MFFGQATSGNPIQHVALPEKTLALGKVGTEGGAQSVIKGRKVAREHLPDRVPLMQIDVVGGYSAACSSLIYEGGAWPAEFNRSMFCTEPILNVIHHEILKPQGATFTGEMVRTDGEFIYSPDYWFRPVDVAPGPDGALYILDFYNPVIAHSDTRGPLHSKAGASVRPDREHYFGRIYRVQHDHAKQLDVPDLTKADIAGLALKRSRIRTAWCGSMRSGCSWRRIRAKQPWPRSRRWRRARNSRWRASSRCGACNALGALNAGRAARRAARWRSRHSQDGRADCRIRGRQCGASRTGGGRQRCRSAHADRHAARPLRLRI